MAMEMGRCNFFQDLLVLCALRIMAGVAFNDGMLSSRPAPTFCLLSIKFLLQFSMHCIYGIRKTVLAAICCCAGANTSSLMLLRRACRKLRGARPFLLVSPRTRTRLLRIKATTVTDLLQHAQSSS